jgi:hypothetical protein
LNPRPPRCERGALPLSYTPRVTILSYNLGQVKRLVKGGWRGQPRSGAGQKRMCGSPAATQGRNGREEKRALSPISHYDRRTLFIVSLSSRVSADLTMYPSEAQLAKSCLNSP